MEIDSDAEMEEPEEEERENDNDNDVDNEEPEPEEEDGPNMDIDVEAVAEDDNDGDDDVDEEADEEDEDDQEDEIQSENDVEEAQPIRPLRIKLKIPVPPSRSGGTETPGVESEDSMDSHPSTSTAAKPMTTRQAVLASMVDSSHVSLGGSRQSKKKVLNESELALRREETARKRKNMTEKKLEDEKVILFLYAIALAHAVYHNTS